MDAGQITDGESFLRWLKARPEASRVREARVLAMRTAARVLPWSVAGFGNRGAFPEVTFGCLRALTVARTFSLEPALVSKGRVAAAIRVGIISHDSNAVVGFAAHAAELNAAAAAMAAHTAAANVRHAAAASAANAAANAANAVASAAHAAASAAHAANATAAWASLERDCTEIETFGIDALLASPLWLDAAQKDRMIGRAQEDFRSIIDDAPNGHVWLRWHDHVLYGARASDEVEELYVHPDLDDLWAKGPDVVNAWIAERLAEIDGRVDLEAEKIAVETGAGATIVIEGDQAVLRPVSTTGDKDTADDPVAQQLHAELLKALPALIDQTARCGNREGWVGIDTTAHEYARYVQQGLPEMAGSVARFWNLSSKLGRYIDQDDRLRAGDPSFAEPLDTDVRRAILDALDPGAPLVRRFPTGLTLDEDHLRWKQPQERSIISIQMLQSAKQQQILHGPSADQIIDTHLVGQNQGIQAAKSRSWAGRLTRAFMLAVIIYATPAGHFVNGVATKAGEQFAERSELVRRFTDFLLQQESRIIELTQDLPPDIAAKIREIIRRLHNQPPTPSPPTTTPV